jgi:hypothetical protein
MPNRLLRDVVVKIRVPQIALCESNMLIKKYKKRKNNICPQLFIQKSFLNSQSQNQSNPISHK